MQGRKDYTEKLFTSFQLSSRVPKENLYRKLRETLDLSFLYKDTKELYGKTGNPSIDPIVFFKLLLTGYLENITSDRKLVEHCSMRMDVLNFLGFDIDEELPWHSTISRTKELYPASLVETLFNKVFTLCVNSGMVSVSYTGISLQYVNIVLVLSWKSLTLIAKNDDKKEIIRNKQIKSSRSYDEKFKVRVVQEITSGLLSQRAAALK